MGVIAVFGLPISLTCLGFNRCVVDCDRSGRGSVRKSKVLATMEVQPKMNIMIIVFALLGV